MNKKKNSDKTAAGSETKPLDHDTSLTQTEKKLSEIGGRKNGLEPTRYGDWELKGKCVDF